MKFAEKSIHFGVPIKRIQIDVSGKYALEPHTRSVSQVDPNIHPCPCPQRVQAADYASTGRLSIQIPGGRSFHLAAEDRRFSKKHAPE